MALVMYEDSYLSFGIAIKTCVIDVVAADILHHDLFANLPLYRGSLTPCGRYLGEELLLILRG